jgi:hypothetical protein
MFFTIMSLKNIASWGGGVIIKNMEVRSSSLDTCNLVYIDYLGDLIR